MRVGVIGRHDDHVGPGSHADEDISRLAVARRRAVSRRDSHAVRAVAVRPVSDGREIGVKIGSAELPPVRIRGIRRMRGGGVDLIPEEENARGSVRVLEVAMLVVNPVVDIADDDARPGLPAEIRRTGGPVVGPGLGRGSRVVEAWPRHVDGGDARHARQRRDVLVHGHRNIGRHDSVGKAGPDDHAQGLQVGLAGLPLQPEAHVGLAVDLPGHGRAVLANVRERLVRVHHRRERLQLHGCASQCRNRHVLGKSLCRNCQDDQQDRQTDIQYGMPHDESSSLEQNDQPFPTPNLRRPQPTANHRLMHQNHKSITDPRPKRPSRRPPQGRQVFEI